MKGAEIIRSIETEEINRVKQELNKQVPEIYVGDTVRVGVRIKEGNKRKRNNNYNKSCELAIS